MHMYRQQQRGLGGRRGSFICRQVVDRLREKNEWNGAEETRLTQQEKASLTRKNGKQNQHPRERKRE